MADRLIQLFSDTLKVDPDSLREDSSPDNTHGWDSLAAMNLVSEIEDTFDVELSTKEIMRMRSIALAREVLVKKGIVILTSS